MPSFHNNGAEVHYDVAGDGSPLLMIAGLASDSASWGPLPPLLGGRQLILVDNRGSGRTRVEGALALDDMVSDCAALLDHLGLQRVDVVGHSLGGFLALALAAQHPGRVGRVVTLGTAGLDAKARALLDDMARLGFVIPPEDWFRLLYQWLFSAPFFADAANVAAAATASAAYPYRQSPGDFARQVAAIARGAAVNLATVTQPVLALAAADDLLAPPAAVRALHASIGNVRHELLTGAAHSMHWEQPAAVARVVVDFLNA